MDKFWIVYADKSGKNVDCDDMFGMYRCNGGKYTSGKFDTLAKAQEHAKQQTSLNLGRKYVIMEAMSVTVPPVPDVQITEITTPVVAST